ncbi:uncharacterized protein LOC131877971 isoform X6 [Tigriopus californicus]|uniref:uncharacterized protein LOC131877971 isoform X6 n=1 Tax=Tigriopus californicus TaxID=6832 RepID=UPI0027DA3885|nr:uncharacterized protein LOC131877971 isoform X6 [Tigriopus californicus]
MNWQLKTSWKVLVLLLALQVASFLPETARGYAIDDDGRNPRSGDENPQPYYEDPLDEFSINGYPQIGPFGDDYLSQPDNHYDYFEDKDGPISSEEESAESAEHPGSPLMLENHTDDEGSSAEDLKTVQKRYSMFPNEFVKRRLCIRPTMSCNLRPNSCCPSTTCRCNLWGQNCRCLRMGLFQRWG